MRLPSRRIPLSLAAASLVAFSLTACGGDSESEAAPSTSESTEPSEATEPTESEEPTASADGDSPDWALPVNDEGEVISTFDVGDLTVEVHQIGIEKATETGNFADPETNKPLVEVGDEVVFVNYVVTNNGDPIDLGSSIVSVDARYDSWPYLQGMDGITDDDLMEKLGINDSAIDVAGKGIPDPPIYTLGSGQSINFAENFEYEKGGAISFDGTATPVDDEGDLISDDRMEGEGTGTTP